MADDIARNPALRADQIMRELLRSGQVAVDRLSEQFQVDSSTIRRDLEKLERQKLLKRVHGGAVLLDALAHTAYADDLTFQSNSGKCAEEKNAIALAAAQLIEPGDAIALSPGTTTTQLARVLRHLQIPGLTVVTNAVNIAMELASLRGVNLILCGGMMLPDFYATVGPLAEQGLAELYVDKAFLGITGISAEHGLTGPNQLEAQTHRLTLSRAHQAIVLADHTKLGRTALYRIAPLTSIHTLITDGAAAPGQVREFENAGVVVRVAGAAKEDSLI
jgi:DeoR/GlpR family transcriptional regulator of sugar metabolism